MNVNPGDLILPRVANYPPYLTSAGTEIVDLMFQLGRPLDPWQAWILTHGLGQVEDEVGDLEMAADTCGCWVSRQNGKGDLIMALEVGWLWLFGVPLSVHTAHQYRTAKEGFLRLKQLYEENEEALGRSVGHIWSGAGQHGIELTRKFKSARLNFLARAGSAGLGFSVPKLVMDEAQMLDADLMQTLMPTMSAQPDSQIWFFGTPPRKDTAWIYKIKERGEANGGGVAWFDYGIDYIDPSTPEFAEVVSDPETWRQTNPSIGVRRPNKTGVRMKAATGELETLGLSMEFAMERCGMWLPKARTAGDHAIDPKVWRSRIAAKPEVPGDIALAFHVNARRTHATIMWAGKIDGYWRIGIADHRPGTSWLLPRLAELKVKYAPVAVTVDARSETTIDELKTIGIKLPEDEERPKRGDLILPSMSDVATAYGMIVDAANNSQLLHHNEPPLNSAVIVPARPLAGGATFDHKTGVEVGPSTGAGLAMWAFMKRIDLIVSDYDPLAFIH